MGLFCRTIASRRSDFMHIDHRAGVLHTDHCPPSRRFPTHTNRPPSQRTAQLDARACAARPKGKYSRGRMALAPIRTRRIFPATGLTPQPSLPILFKQLLRHTQVLCFFPCTPRATAFRQARVSGGNLQNCAPSAACGGAMTQERNVSLRIFRILRSPFLIFLSISAGGY